MQKILMRNEMANNTSEYLAAASTESNTKFKWSDELIEDWLRAFSHFKTVMGFQNKNFNADKPRQNNISFLLTWYT